MNPAAFIYDLLLCSGEVEADAVDFASFAVAAETLSDERAVMTSSMEDGASASLVRDVLDQIDGVLFVDVMSGLITLRLIRAPGAPS